MGEAETKPAAGNVSKELSKDDLLRYVELDLWNRFQERLWKIVGLVLTGVTVLGLLGVPYYIKSEVASRLESREKEFAERTNELMEYAKVLAVLRAKYDGERYRFDSNVLRLVDALNKGADPKGAAGSGDFDPADELGSLISRPDFSEVVAGSEVAARPLQELAGMENRQVLPPTYITVSGRGVNMEAAGEEPHPIKDGTYGGTIRDLKLRVVVLEALRRSIDRIQEDMLAVGGNSGEAKKAGAVTAASLHAELFPQLFSMELTSVASGFLIGEERAVFEKNQRLYTLGYKADYVPAPSQLKGGAGR